jgi:hypothetical protein
VGLLSGELVRELIRLLEYNVTTQLTETRRTSRLMSSTRDEATEGNCNSGVLLREFTAHASRSCRPIRAGLARRGQRHKPRGATTPLLADGD